MKAIRKAGLRILAGIRARPGLAIGGIKRSTHYKVVCKKSMRVKGYTQKEAPGGWIKVVKWIDEFDNLVVTAGLNDSLDKHLKGSGYTAGWYIGLTDGTPSFAAADTMSSHAGWTEVEDYDEAARVTLTLGAVSAGSVDNSGDVAVYTISGAATIGGAFVASDDEKGGTAGVLYGGGAFSGGDRTLGDGDVLEITVYLTAAAA